MEAICTRHRDSRHGGYFWSFDDEGPRERDKLAYGHAFVLLAAASAKCAGHPQADALLAEVADVLETRFSGRRNTALARRNSATTGRRSAPIAARTPTCI